MQYEANPWEAQSKLTTSSLLTKSVLISNSLVYKQNKRLILLEQILHFDLSQKAEKRYP